MKTDTSRGGTACREYEWKLEDYLGGSLNPIHARSVEQHLAGCADCRDALDDAKSAARLFTVAGPFLEGTVEARPEFARLTMARVRVENERRAAEAGNLWQPLVFFAWRFAATAMLALMILLSYAVRGHGHSQSQKVVGPIGQQQLVDVFSPDPTRAPANQDEFLLMVAGANHVEH